MSYDTALGMWIELAERYLEREEESPTPEITQFVEAFLAQWPDLDESSDGPLGQLPHWGRQRSRALCVDIVPDRQEETSVHVAELARNTA
jgi:hypothetical protein